MTRGPGRIATAASVRDRVRRLPRTPDSEEAKRVLAEDPSATAEAMDALYRAGLITEAHVEAHLRWIMEQMT